MPLYLFYTMVQKIQKWPKTQIKGGGPALNRCWLHWSFWAYLFCTTCRIAIHGFCQLDRGGSLQVLDEGALSFGLKEEKP